VVKIEIEIPDPPEGWVYEGYRQGLPGELTFRGAVWMRCDSQTVLDYPIAVKAKPLWEPSPELVALVLPGWGTRNMRGYCRWHKKRPRKGSDHWYSCQMESLEAVRPDLLPPITIPWDQCCFKIGEPE
jgi:hypothetical protein